MSRVLVPTPPDRPGSLKRLARMEIPAAADLVLLGDSNAAGWPADLLAAALPGLRIANLGLPGDRIQNTLWRLARPDLAHLRPRDVVVILGTNNLADGDAAEEIAAGLLAVADAIDAVWATPRIVMPAIARRRAGPLARSVEREALNGILLGTERPRLTVVRSDLLLDALGPAAFEEDGIHIGRRGYESVTEALAALLDA